tara:strand:+ start:403 stop:657 length:255 start_codon:yes stop_codon:yes gene_type:complete
VLTLFSLLMAIDLYIDDVERATQGSFYWVRVGRPLADFPVLSLILVVPQRQWNRCARLFPLLCCLQLEWLALVHTAFVRLSGLP